MSHRRVIVALFALALLLPAAAGAMGVEKGVKAGVNFSGFRGEFADQIGTERKLGFVGGAFVAFDFAPDLAIQVEGLFSMKGMKVPSVDHTDEGGDPLGEFDTFVNLTYVEVPVLLRGTLLRTSPVQPMYYLGPTVGFSLGGKVQSGFSAIPDQDLTDLKAVDFGLALGAGAGFKLGGKKVLTEIRWTTGLADIYDIEDNLESINSVFSLTAGVAF
jgi:hypothetical protein